MTQCDAKPRERRKASSAELATKASKRAEAASAAEQLRLTAARQAAERAKAAFFQAGHAAGAAGAFGSDGESSEFESEHEHATGLAPSDGHASKPDVALPAATQTARAERAGRRDARPVDVQAELDDDDQLDESSRRRCPHPCLRQGRLRGAFCLARRNLILVFF